MEFNFLLTEKVCPLVIRLFSPSLKYRSRVAGSPSASTVQSEKPYFPIVMRLLRIVSVLTRHYSKLLVCVVTNLFMCIDRQSVIFTTHHQLCYSMLILSILLSVCYMPVLGAQK